MAEVNNSEQWRAAFKEIYGRNPTKKDYEFAPSQVKEKFFAEFPPTPVKEEESIPCSKSRKGGVRLKRPRDDESPLKRRPPKARRLCVDEKIQAIRSSPRKNPHGQSSLLLSPVKSCPMSPGNAGPRRAIAPLKELQPKSVLSPVPPKNFQEIGSPVKRVAAFSGFSSLFDTPEKGQPAAWGEMSPQKIIAPPTTSGTPIRSPRKPLVHKEILVKNVECLLLPTPEKRIRKEEELKPFEPEEVVSKKKTFARVPKKDLAVVFDPTTGKVVKRAFKRSVPATKERRKNVEKGNFVRINMKKKSFSRGKVTAEQKRKMRRKQNWRKRMAGGA